MKKKWLNVNRIDRICVHTHAVRLSYYVTYRFSLFFPFAKHDTHSTVLLCRHRSGVDMSNKFVVRKNVHYNYNALLSILIPCVRIERPINVATTCTARFHAIWILTRWNFVFESRTFGSKVWPGILKDFILLVKRRWNFNSNCMNLIWNARCRKTYKLHIFQLKCHRKSSSKKIVINSMWRRRSHYVHCVSENAMVKHRKMMINLPLFERYHENSRHTRRWSVRIEHIWTNSAHRWCYRQNITNISRRLDRKTTSTQLSGVGIVLSAEFVLLTAISAQFAVDKVRLKIHKQSVTTSLHHSRGSWVQQSQTNSKCDFLHHEAVKCLRINQTILIDFSRFLCIFQHCRYYHWAPMYCPNTNYKVRVYIAGQYFIIRHSKRSGIG